MYRISERLDSASERPGLKPLEIRAKFGSVAVSDLQAIVGHTHGLSAANRSTASLLIDTMSRALGLRAWYYQKSSADIRNGRAGNRAYYWAKDLNAEPSAYEPGENDLLAMVDVDQYVDMNIFMSTSFNPYLIYTFQPGMVSKSSGEFSYTFDDNNRCHYRVSGGGYYSHPVWNYDGDSVKCTRSILGITYQTAIYQLERRQMDDDHQLLLLAPMARWIGPWAMLADMFLSGNSLSRLKLATGGFLRMQVKTPDGLKTVTGKTMAHSCASIDASADDEIASIARTSKVGLTLPMVKRKMGDDGDGCEILYEFHKTMSSTRVSTVSKVAEFVRSYQWVDEEYDPEAKPSMVSFMKPIVDGAFCPMMSKSNDRRSVDKRIIEQSNNTVLTNHLLKTIEEFVGLFLGEEEKQFHPCTEDEVWARQPKPTQRRILAESGYLGSTGVTGSFVKREAYTTVNDPRMISTINGADKRDYSAYLYPIADFLKTKEWYAFGKPPSQLAQRVADICSSANTVVNTDFSRMDGRVSEVLRFLESRLMLRAYGDSYCTELVTLMNSQKNLKGRTKFGVSYDTGLARLSGSPETSAFNTIANAFTAYLTFRALRTNTGKYFDPVDCYAKLGIYGGDDGLTADVPPRVYSKMAEKVGQKLDVEPVKRGDFGVKFLARCYSDQVWFGEVSSMCDLPRTLSKFHVTVHMPNNISAEDKLFDKAYALWLTDKNTPILGPFVSRVIELMPGREYKNLCKKWTEASHQHEQYPNEPGSWMDHLCNEQMSTFDQYGFNTYVATADVEELMNLPKFVERPEVVAKPGQVVVDEELIDTPPPITPNTAVIPPPLLVKVNTKHKARPSKPSPKIRRSPRGPRSN